MKNKICIIKIGGNVVNDEQLLYSFLNEFSTLKATKILVHGGGVIATDISKRLGVETVMNEGRRITSKENLEIVTMVYAGLINKKITSKLQGDGCNALGLSGCDGNSIRATKRKVKTVDYGWVGDIQYINTAAIDSFLKSNITPVFCAISHDGHGQLLNTNADTIASEIAIAMSAHYETELIYCFEKNGVLLNVDDPSSVVTHIDIKKYATLMDEKVISDGMIPKLDNCFHALQNGVNKVLIGNTTVVNDRTLCTTLTL